MTDADRRAAVWGAVLDLGKLVGAVGLIAGTLWAAWVFLVPRLPFAQAEQLAPIERQLEQLDKDTTSLTYQYYSREYDRQSLRVWDLQAQKAPPQVLEPLVRERDRTKEIMEQSRSRLKSLTGITVK